MKRGFVVTVCLLFSLFSVSFVFSAEGDASTMFSEQESVQWLANASQQTSDVVERSWAILGLLGTSESSQAGALADALLAQKDETGACWPKGGCHTIDTAMAALALSRAGKNVDDTLAVLQSDTFRTSASLLGQFQLQIQATENAEGTCILTSSQGVTHNILISQGKVVGGLTDYHVSLNQYATNVASHISVDCTQLTVGTILTLQFVQQPNIYYILDNQRTGQFSLVLPNACYRSFASGSCDYLSTAYVTWVLKELKGDVSLAGTSLYLKTQAGNDDLHRAFLVRLFGSQRYGDMLQASQDSSGGWSGGHLFRSAFATFALQTSSVYVSSVEAGKQFLRKHVGFTGSWGNDIRTTSLALLALRGKDLPFSATSVVGPVATSSLEVCDDGFDNDIDGLVDCADVQQCGQRDYCLCDNGIKDIGEQGVDCGGSCVHVCLDDSAEPLFELCANGIDDDGDLDIDCDDLDCVSDFACADAAFGTEDFDEDAFAEEVPEETSYFWLWIVLLLLLLGGGAGFYYIKFVKTGKAGFSDLFSKKKPSMTLEKYKQERVSRPSVTERPFERRSVVQEPSGQQKSSSSPVDAELDKSIKEAEKLLYGDKNKKE